MSLADDIALSTALLNAGLFCEDVEKACAAVKAEGLVVVSHADLRWLVSQVFNGFVVDADAPTFKRLMEAVK